MPQPADTDPVVQELREREVRDSLHRMDELEIAAMHQAAAVDGNNDLLMTAIENAPLALIRDKATHEAGREARGQRHNPENAQTLRQLRAARGAIVAAVDSARFAGLATR